MVPPPNRPQFPAFDAKDDSPAAQESLTRENSEMVSGDSDHCQRHAIHGASSPIMRDRSIQPSTLADLQRYWQRSDYNAVFPLNTFQKPALQNDPIAQPFEPVYSSYEEISPDVLGNPHRTMFGMSETGDIQAVYKNEGPCLWSMLEDSEEYREAHRARSSQDGNLFKRYAVHQVYSQARAAHQASRFLTSRQRQKVVARSRLVRKRVLHRTSTNVKRLVRRAVHHLLAANRLLLAHERVRTRMKSLPAQQKNVNKQQLAESNFIDASEQIWEEVFEDPNDHEKERGYVHRVMQCPETDFAAGFSATTRTESHGTNRYRVRRPHLVSLHEANADPLEQNKILESRSPTPLFNNSFPERLRGLATPSPRRQGTRIQNLPSKVIKAIKERDVVFDPKKFNFDKDMIPVHQLDDGTLVEIEEEISPEFAKNNISVGGSVLPREKHGADETDAMRSVVSRLQSTPTPALQPTTIKARGRQSISIWDEHGIERRGYEIVPVRVYASEDLEAATRAAATATAPAPAPAPMTPSEENGSEIQKWSLQFGPPSSNVNNTSSHISQTGDLANFFSLPFHTHVSTYPQNSRVDAGGKTGVEATGSEKNHEKTTGGIVTTSTAKPAEPQRRSTRKRKRAMSSETPMRSSATTTTAAAAREIDAISSSSSSSSLRGMRVTKYRDKYKNKHGYHNRRRRVVTGK